MIYHSLLKLWGLQFTVGRGGNLRLHTRRNVWLLLMTDLQSLIQHYLLRDGHWWHAWTFLVDVGVIRVIVPLWMKFGRWHWRILLLLLMLLFTDIMLAIWLVILELLQERRASWWGYINDRRRNPCWIRSIQVMVIKTVLHLDFGCCDLWQIILSRGRSRYFRICLYCPP
jgi:hypothetical protein